MNEIDPELDRRLALLREIAEPTVADKHRLRVALHTSIHASTDPTSAPVLAERVAGVARNRQLWATRARPLAQWFTVPGRKRLGRVLIGACATLAIGLGWDRLRSVRDAEPTALDGGAAVAPPNEKTDITSAVRIAERADVVASEQPAGSVNGAAGPDPLDLAEGLQQLHRAERALYAGDAELALGILSNLDQRAGPALLREERLTTLVLALCQRDRVEEALAARRELEREFASSIYMTRIDQSCAVEREPR
jgi:hypothetical protein